MNNHLFFLYKIDQKHLLRLKSCLKGFPISQKIAKTVEIEVSDCRLKNVLQRNKSQIKQYKLYQPQQNRVFAYLQDSQVKKNQQKVQGADLKTQSNSYQFNKIECGDVKFFELLEKYNFFGQRKIKKTFQMVFQSIQWGSYVISVSTLPDKKILLIIQEKNVSTIFKSKNLKNILQQRMKATFQCVLHFLFEHGQPKIGDSIYLSIKRCTQKLWRIIRQFPQTYKKCQDSTAREDQRQIYDIKFWMIARIMMCQEAF